MSPGSGVSLFNALCMCVHVVCVLQMGFLEAGTPLMWKDAMQYLEHGESERHIHTRALMHMHTHAQRETFMLCSIISGSPPRHCGVGWAVRKHGILQFVHVYNNVKHREGDVLKWGDEVCHCSCGCCSCSCSCSCSCR